MDKRVTNYIEEIKKEPVRLAFSPISFLLYEGYFYFQLVSIIIKDRLFELFSIDVSRFDEVTEDNVTVTKTVTKIKLLTFIEFIYGE